MNQDSSDLIIIPTLVPNGAGICNKIKGTRTHSVECGRMGTIESNELYWSREWGRLHYTHLLHLSAITT
jgi:hypothetical protein